MIFYDSRACVQNTNPMYSENSKWTFQLKKMCFDFFSRNFEKFENFNEKTSKLWKFIFSQYRFSQKWHSGKYWFLQRMIFYDSRACVQNMNPMYSENSKWTFQLKKMCFDFFLSKFRKFQKIQRKSIKTLKKYFFLNIDFLKNGTVKNINFCREWSSTIVERVCKIWTRCIRKIPSELFSWKKMCFVFFSQNFENFEKFNEKASKLWKNIFFSISIFSKMA